MSLYETQIRADPRSPSPSRGTCVQLGKKPWTESCNPDTGETQGGRFFKSCKLSFFGRRLTTALQLDNGRDPETRLSLDTYSMLGPNRLCKIQVSGLEPSVPVCSGEQHEARPAVVAGPVYI